MTLGRREKGGSERKSPRSTGCLLGAAAGACGRGALKAGLFFSNSYGSSTVNMKHARAFGSCTGSLLLSGYQPIVVLRVLLIGFCSN